MTITQKSWASAFLFGSGLTLASFLMFGCGTVGGMFQSSPVVQPATTNIVQQIIPASTNSAGQVSPPATNSIVVIQPATTQQVYSVSPAANAGIEIGQAAAVAVPAPFNGLAEGGLALLSGVLGLVAAWKNKQLSAAQKIAAVVEPIVAGVEAAASPAVKQSIQSHAAAAGVQAVLDPIVQSVTAQMPKKT